MTKIKYLTILFIVLALILIIPNISNSTTDVDVKRNIYSMDGSMKFTFTGLTIDTTHEYEYGLTKTAATAVEDWYLVTENTATSVTANIMTGTKEMREVINAVDTGYITIKDKTTDTVVLEPYAVDLKLPFLRVTNYEVISNGQNLDGDYEINVPLRNAANSEAYYKYEKITDQNLINKYKEIKANSSDYTALESMLKTSAPTSGYSSWGYWNGHGSDGRNGFGYTTKTVNAPDEGLYYLWVYFSGESIKNLYGCMIVDNLQPYIAVDGISLPSTKNVELGKTITLYPTFNPSTATNKIVTWSSSDEEVATVDNAGKITPNKVGSTIITVTSQDGNKKATCTVTVTEVQNQDSNEEETITKKAYGNHTYYIFEKNMTWQEAKAFCESQGGYLVTVNSSAEQEFIEAYVKEKGYNDNRFWIGATASTGTWKWVTGEKFSYTNWGENQPDNGYGTQFYAVLHGYEYTYSGHPVKVGQWDDLQKEGGSTREDIYFICEWGSVTVDENDTTTAPDTQLPQTGVSMTIVISIITIAVVSLILYKKYSNYKDIK